MNQPPIDLAQRQRCISELARLRDENGFLVSRKDGRYESRLVRWLQELDLKIATASPKASDPAASCQSLRLVPSNGTASDATFAQRFVRRTRS
jgi:hypothetical protein